MRIRVEWWDHLPARAIEENVLCMLRLLCLSIGLATTCSHSQAALG